MTYTCPICRFTCNTSMTNVSRLHNKHLRIVRNASRYLRNIIIRRDLNALTFRKRVIYLSKKNCGNLYNLPNEILVELSAYDACEPDHNALFSLSLNL